MRLYVWEDVLCDYTCGAVFALAHNVDEARKVVLEKCGVYGDEAIRRAMSTEPTECNKPEGFFVWGGG